MYVNQSLKKFYSEDAEIKKKIRFSNVFSKMKRAKKINSTQIYKAILIIYQEMLDYW